MTVFQVNTITARIGISPAAHLPWARNPDFQTFHLFFLFFLTFNNLGNLLSLSR